MLDKTPRVLKVTEARVLIYEKADDQPEYHIPICKKLNLTGWLIYVIFLLNKWINFSTVDVKKIN